MNVEDHSTSDCSKIETYEMLNALRSRTRRLREAGLFNVILFGAPGCGKGTHSEWLSKRYNLCHISTGDALREEIASGSALGNEVQGILSRGELVGDELVNAIVESKIERELQSPRPCKGFIFDGYPRTLVQVKALETMLQARNSEISVVLYFKCSEKTLKYRVCGRLVHRPSGRVYHKINKPPKVEGRDDVTGEELVQREDDNETSLVIRLNNFYSQTQPLLDYFREQAILNTFDSNREAAEVKDEIVRLFNLYSDNNWEDKCRPAA